MFTKHKHIFKKDKLDFDNFCYLLHFLMKSIKNKSKVIDSIISTIFKWIKNMVYFFGVGHFNGDDHFFDKKMFRQPPLIQDHFPKQ